MHNSSAALREPAAGPPLHFKRLRAALYILLGLVAAGLLAYAELHAFVWDEGFHLLAAPLIV
ncbi:MAG: hypothetical protein JOZ22_13380, partial [Acidobacteriia bacterium]|nr:hypothetical protein [Terriglobia bacterium]